jgi:bacteriocin-like protein
MKALSDKELTKVSGGGPGLPEEGPCGDCMVSCGQPGPWNPGHSDCIYNCITNYC